MKKKFFRILAVFNGLWLLALSLQAQEPATIKLNPPDLKRGLPFMETLSVKASVREISLHFFQNHLS